VEKLFGKIAEGLSSVPLWPAPKERSRYPD
jgi:hypothetical protein